MTQKLISVHTVHVYILVTQPQQSTCRSQETIKAASTSKLLSSVVSLETKCGLHNTPWLIEAKEGQHIEIALTDFSWRNETSDFMKCTYKYGYMLDTQHDDVINLCGGGKRQRDVYVSKGHSLQIILDENVLSLHRFLIGYKCKIYIIFHFDQTHQIQCSYYHHNSI